MRLSPRTAGRAPGLVALVAILGIGCSARTAPAPGPGYVRGGLPELRGARVMVLPVQIRSGVHPDVDREIAYALGRSSGVVGWVMPDDLREALGRNPATGTNIDELPVSAFLVAEIERIGDPLYGDLYRLSTLVDARYALVPVEAEAKAHEAMEAVEITAVLVDVRSGRVLWQAIVEGSRGPPGSLPLTASAADALARRLSP